MYICACNDFKYITINAVRAVPTIGRRIRETPDYRPGDNRRLHGR